MRMSPLLPAVALLLSAACFAQLPSSQCDATQNRLEDCPLLTHRVPVQNALLAESPSQESGSPSEIMQNSPDSSANPVDKDPSASTIPPQAPKKEGFHWGRALLESGTFLVIEQGYVVHTDFNWVVVENGIPFNHYWRDYMQSLTTWWHAGWSAGEDPLFNYVGHPIQGAMTSYIQIQNDPRSEKLEYANTREYWRSRLKATIWNAVYSTQWSIGPLSEMTVEKYGAKVRPPWNADGSYPCNTKTCYAGVGKVNLVMTPVGGLGWMLVEDILDKKITEELVESHTHNRLLIDAVRCSLNPIRGGANILHGNRPWYRAGRDHPAVSLFSDPTTSIRKNAVSSDQVSVPSLPSRGNLFFGYLHSADTHCEAIFSAATSVCNPLSAKTANLSGWNVSVEAKYLRYFGVVADFSGQYGAATQTNFLFGVRGGASLGRFRPYAQALVGAVHAQDNGSTVQSPARTSFAEDLGVGNDFRVVRLLSWRFQVDVLKTGSPQFKQYNVRTSSGVSIRF
jgi:hypothetical protein